MTTSAPWAEELPDVVDSVFGPDGLLVARGREHRPGQYDLARAIDDTLALGECLMAEGPCFTPEALVRVGGEYRRIDACEAGMEIETLHGPASIARTMRRSYDGEAVTLKTNSGFEPVTVTSSHRFYVLRRSRCTIKSRANTLCSPLCDRTCPVRGAEPFSAYAIKAVEAHALTLDDCLLFRQPRERFGRRTEDAWYLELLGYWLAEGHADTGRTGVAFLGLTFNADERETLVARSIECARALGADANFHERKSNSIRLKVHSRALAERMIADCGEKADRKHLPGWFGDLSREQQLVVLTALFRGDAHIRTRPSRVRGGRDSEVLRYVTISPALAMGVRDALLGLGIRCSCYTEQAHTDAKGVAHRKTYRIIVSRRFMAAFGNAVTGIRRDLKQVEHAEGGQVYTLLPIRSIKAARYQGDVFNLTSAGHDSYLTDAGLSKNCGTGKSLAYLVPTIAFAMERGVRAILATESIALQEQVFLKDLPEAIRLLDGHLSEHPRVAVLKGRSNYVCLQALLEPPEEPDLLGALTAPEREQLRVVDRWAHQTATGDRAELPFVVSDAVWRLRSVSHDDCLRDGCPHREECFASKARQQAEKADVLVVNHHLVCAHFAMREELDADAFLPRWGVLVLDEAHGFADTARDAFGATLTPALTRRAVRWLERQRKAKSYRDPLVLDLLAASDAFWAGLARALPASSKDTALRLVEPLWDDDTGSTYYLALDRVRQRAAALADALEELPDLGDDEKAEKQRARNLERKLTKALSWLWHSFVPRLNPDVVFWIERSDARGTPRWSLEGRLLDPAALLTKHLWENGGRRPVPVIATSATLTTGRGRAGWGFMRRLLGAPEAVHAFAVPSPFDLARQALLYLPSGLPNPSKAREAFDTAVCSVVEETTQASGGRALALFTSRRMAERARDRLRGAPFRVLCQGEAPRTQLVEVFRQDRTSVLLGTTSLWTGVDVQGESCVLVLIDKLPFPNRSEPLVAALDEAAARRTGDTWAGFREEQLPRAVLALRQGVGRLIRSKSDWGVVAICDPRLTTSTYGPAVVEALALPTQTRRLSDVRAWFARRGGTR